MALLDASDRHGHLLPLNAWAYDFFKHGSLSALTHENGVRLSRMHACVHACMHACLPACPQTLAQA